MQRLVGAIVVASLITLFAHGQAKTDPKIDDLKKLEGVWKVVQAEKEGKVVAAEEAKLMKVTFKEGSMIISGKFEDVAAIKIDPTKKPAEIDLAPASAPKSIAKGIYTFEGDTLKICWSKVGDERPKDFTAKVPEKAENPFRLMVLTKEK